MFTRKHQVTNSEWLKENTAKLVSDLNCVIVRICLHHIIFFHCNNYRAWSSYYLIWRFRWMDHIHSDEIIIEMTFLSKTINFDIKVCINIVWLSWILQYWSIHFHDSSNRNSDELPSCSRSICAQSLAFHEIMDAKLHWSSRFNRPTVKYS